MLHTLSLEGLLAKDPFGRTAVMLAAKFNRWAVLQQLLKLPDGIDWSERQKAQASVALLL